VIGSTISSTGRGVAGSSLSGTGVVGVSESGSGVAGEATKPYGVGVRATGTGGAVALQVAGRTRFDKYTASRVKVLRGRSSVKVYLAGITSSSQAFAALKTYRAGCYVAAVVPTAGAFTIYLNKALPSDTWVAYFIVN
jgi:hypothetical protein